MTGMLARSVALTGADQAIRTAAGVYRGYTLRETAGATAVVRVWDNASAGSGTLLDSVSLAANGSSTACYPVGVWAESGVFVEVVSGTVEGSIRIG